MTNTVIEKSIEKNLGSFYVHTGNSGFGIEINNFNDKKYNNKWNDIVFCLDGHMGTASSENIFS